MLGSDETCCCSIRGVEQINDEVVALWTKVTCVVEPAAWCCILLAYEIHLGHAVQKVARKWQKDMLRQVCWGLLWGMSVSMVENGTISPDQMYEPDRARVGC